MPKPTRRVAEVIKGLRAPSLKEFHRAMERAGKVSFNDWNDEIFRQTIRLATRQALRLVGATPKEMRFILRARDELAQATNRSQPPDKFAVAAVMRRIPKDFSKRKLTAFNLAYRYTKSKILKQRAKQLGSLDRFRNLVGLPPDSEIEEVVQRAVKAGLKGMKKTLPGHVVELAAKHACRAVDGNPEKLASVIDAIKSATLEGDSGKNAGPKEVATAMIKAIGTQNVELFAQTYNRNFRHIQAQMIKIVGEKEKQATNTAT